MKKIYVWLSFIGIVVVILMVSIITYSNLENYTEEVQLIRHSGEVINVTKLIMSTIKDAEIGHRGFQLTGDTTYLEPYYSAIAMLPKELKTLDSLVNNTRQKDNVDSLKILIQDHFLIISNILANVEHSGLYMDRYESKLLTRSKDNMNAIRSVGDKILLQEQSLFGARMSLEKTYRKITPLALLFYTIIALIGVIFLFTRILSSLEKSQEAERKLSENLIQQKLQIALLEEHKVLLNEAESLSQMGSWKWTEHNNHVVWSEGLYAIFDQKPDVPVSWNTFLEKVVADDKPLVQKFLNEVITEKKDSRIDYRIMMGDHIRYLSLTAKSQHATKMEGVILGTVIDITENKLYEKQLQQYNADLKRSNEDLEQFAYVASHDLQEPLRKIRAFGDRLTAKFSPQLKEQGIDYITRMQAASARMQLLIEDLLSFSRVSQAEGEFQLLDPRSILIEALEDMDEQVKQENAEVRISIMPPFYGDKFQIKRLFQNLVGNAIKFHKPHEKPVIDVGGKIIDRAEIENEVQLLTGAQFVRFSIKDNGIGFDEKYADRIFNIFQRLNGRAAYEGTGIGLAICRKIVENHCGYITAKSIENIGSEFIVIFPTDLVS
ncbi:MAG TPA: ATP-binding protein [Cyclobacteriaceae bacterium]|nr:ATP-binding protein [Cyclobacteriaceae bacterium]